MARTHSPPRHGLRLISAEIPSRSNFSSREMFPPLQLHGVEIDSPGYLGAVAECRRQLIVGWTGPVLCSHSVPAITHSPRTDQTCSQITERHLSFYFRKRRFALLGRRVVAADCGVWSDDIIINEIFSRSASLSLCLSGRNVNTINSNNFSKVRNE